MNDLDRMKEIEEIFGFPLHQVAFDNLLRQKSFQTDHRLRNYSVDEEGFITGLALEFSSGFLLPDGLFSGFERLQQLILKFDYLSDYSFLGELKSLTTLNLSNNEIIDGSFLGELRSLTTLHLDGNKIEDVSFLGELKSLTSLSLRSNFISDASSVRELKSLTTLNLSNNNISDAPVLGRLKSLTTLNLSNNKISDVSVLGKLKSLTTLNLSNNEIIDGSSLGELRSLTTLYLDGNKIDDISFLGELKSLTSLTLRSNRLSDASSVRELKSLTTLDLSNNNISDASVLGELKSLTTLYLGKNQISNTSFLRELKSLTSLNLSKNQISDTSFLPEMKLLRILDLRKNEGLRDKIPEEILDNQFDAQKIVNYYLKTTEGETKPLNEAKIVVVGEADFGKSLLIHRLLYNKYIDTKSTTGIQIGRWDDVTVNGQKVQLNVWDFGGQEIMHSTHQFFFTKRTIYVLVVDARQNEDKNKTEEWLKRIESFGGDSPVIIVGSHVDQNQRDTAQTGRGYFPISERELERKFPKNIKGFYGVCSDVRIKGFDDLFENFRNGLIDEVSKLNGIHEPFPADWFAIKDELEAMKERKVPFISERDYFTNCNDRKVKDKISQDTIREFLNDIGTIIYFEDLPGRMIFSPEWITNGVYGIVDNPQIIQNKGELDISDLTKILEQKDYKPDEHKFILDLMRKFELCVDIEPDRRFLIPDLLLKVEEPYTGEWTSTLGFQYQYETYLKSIFTRFVVRMYPFIFKKTWWKNGVVLEHEGGRALVKFDSSSKKVVINIRGEVVKKRQYLLAIIRKEFQEIHGKFAVLPFKEFAAHPSIKIKNDNGEDVELLRDYDELIKAEEDGETRIYVKELRRKVSISEWLDGIEEDRSRRRENPGLTGLPFTIREDEERNVLNQIQSDLTRLNNEKDGFDLQKREIDGRVDVWAFVVRFSIGLLLFSGLGYAFYWTYRNFDWIRDNWTSFEIILALIPVAAFVFLWVFFLIKKKKISEEMAVKLIEGRIQHRLYRKRGFDVMAYENICIQIEQKESELKMYAPDFAARVETAERAMLEDRDALRKLAE
jgi:small GTP-binding protein